jgi:hypothetical protein
MLTTSRTMKMRSGELVLGKVVPRIQAELLECRPVTIHDGILCQSRFTAAASENGVRPFDVRGEKWGRNGSENGVRPFDVRGEK